jgi:hypothetical protein
MRNISAPDLSVQCQRLQGLHAILGELENLGKGTSENMATANIQWKCRIGLEELISQTEEMRRAARSRLEKIHSPESIKIQEDLALLAMENSLTEESTRKVILGKFIEAGVGIVVAVEKMGECIAGTERSKRKEEKACSSIPGINAWLEKRSMPFLIESELVDSQIPHLRRKSLKGYKMLHKD